MNRLLAIALLAAAAPAAAKESPRRGTFEFRIVPYRPNIDAEFGGAASPYADAFGNGRKIMMRTDVAWTLLRGYGSLDAGLGIGYVQARGHGRVSTTGEVSSDPTALRIVPTSVSLAYRFDVLANRWGIPFAPYGRVALERYNWWITKGTGGNADAAGRSGRGATNGYSVTGGVAFLLDIVSPGLARDMDRDTGVNDTYVYAEVSRSKIDDFGSDSSFDLSPDRKAMFGFGLLFVF